MFDELIGDRFQYFALLLFALAVTLPLEFFYGFRVWRDPKRLFRCLWPTAVVMVAWDYFAIARGHWTFSTEFLTGWQLPGGMPIEEFLFFVFIPAAGISGFEATRTQLRRWGIPRNGEPGHRELPEKEGAA